MAVGILATNEGKLDCHSCDDGMKSERGHYQDGSIPFLVDGKRIFRCPLTMITTLSYEYIRAFRFYEKGSYPNGVVWRKESNKYIQAMMILDNEFTKWRDSANEPKKKMAS